MGNCKGGLGFSGPGNRIFLEKFGFSGYDSDRKPGSTKFQPGNGHGNLSKLHLESLFSIQYFSPCSKGHLVMVRVSTYSFYSWQFISNMIGIYITLEIQWDNTPRVFVNCDELTSLALWTN